MASSVGFDFWLPGGSLGGFCWLSDRAGFVAGLVGEGRPYVLVKDLEARPRAGTLEVRAEGLWAAFHHEGEGHWSWGLEAFGVAFDDPEEALRSEWGDRTALGFDLEWEAPDTVHGEILVGPSERIPFDGFGRAYVGIPMSARPEAEVPPKGFGGPLRVGEGPEGGVVLKQWLTPEGWVRAGGGWEAGTA
jgi:hypothetical protein